MTLVQQDTGAPAWFVWLVWIADDLRVDLRVFDGGPPELTVHGG